MFVSIVFKQILQEVMQKMFSNQSFSKNQSESFGYRTLGSGFGRQEVKNESMQLSHTASFRATSPKSANSKTKIKLVSPFKNKGNNNATLKENNPPVKISGFAKSPSHLHRNSSEIQLGGKTNQKPTVTGHAKNYSDLSVPQTYERPVQQVLVTPQAVHPSSFKRVVPYMTVETHSRPIQTRKVVSPSKICINNKSFDIGTIKSKIVYVVPLRNKSETFEHHANDRKVSRQDVTANPVFPSELAIQEQNSLQDLKDSYESQMKEIKQLQQQIQDNNVQIKELLRASNVSRHISTSRLSNHQEEINHSEENLSLNLIDEKQAKIEVKNVSQPVTSRRQSSQIIQPVKVWQQVRVELQRDEVSVQTDMPDCSEDSTLLQKNESRHSKFSISKNAECEIQLIGSKGQEYSSPIVPEQENQYTFANDLQEKKEQLRIQSQSSINHQVLRESTFRKQVSPQISQKALEILANQEEIIPVSQRSIQSKGQSKLISNEVEVNLQASRAETEKSIIRSSNIGVEHRQSQNIITPRMGIQTIKSADNIPVLTKPRPIQTKKPSESRSQLQKHSESSILNQPQQKSVPVTPTSTRPNPAPEELKTSIISGSSGKRRINNSIYL